LHNERNEVTKVIMDHNFIMQSQLNECHYSLTSKGLSTYYL